MITALDHIALAVADFEAATDAYEALLGRRAARTPPQTGAVRAWFHLDNLSLEIIAPSGAGPAGDRVRQRLADQGDGLLALALRVEDLGAATRLLERRGLATAPIDGAAMTAALLSPESSFGLPIALTEGSARERSEAIGDPGACLNALDHVVIQTPNPDRACALYGARLGLDLRLDRTNPAWGTRLMFFRCGASVIEVGHGLTGGVSDGPDQFGGLAWRVADPDAARARMAEAGFNVSEVRTGRKPGTRIFTVRDRTSGVPTLVLSATSD